MIFYNFTLFLKSGFCSRNSIILNILLTKKATFLARKFISVIWQVFIKIEYLDKVILLPQSVELMKHFAVYIQLIAICGHILQKVLYNRTFMRVEYILYLPAVFIKLDPNGQSLGSIYKSWCWKMALNSIKMVRWRSSTHFPYFSYFLIFSTCSIVQPLP